MPSASFLLPPASSSGGSADDDSTADRQRGLRPRGAGSRAARSTSGASPLMGSTGRPTCGRGRRAGVREAEGVTRVLEAWNLGTGDVSQAGPAH